MSNVLITEPAVEPISVDEFKLFGKIDDTNEDALYAELIKAARIHFELTTGLALITQTWRHTMDALPGAAGVEEPWWDGVRQGAIGCLTSVRNWIELPTAPLISITNFKAFQGDNSFTTFTSYYSDTDSKPGRLLLNFGSVWPVATRNAQRYSVEYVAGFGPAAANVPSDIRICIRQLALHFNENRELMTFDTAAIKVPLQCERIMTRRKIKRI